MGSGNLLRNFIIYFVPFVGTYLSLSTLSVLSTQTQNAPDGALCKIYELNFVRSICPHLRWSEETAAPVSTRSNPLIIAKHTNR